MNRKANSTLENSMLKPLTSSLSASARSKGLRLVSARIMIVAGMDLNAKTVVNSIAIGMNLWFTPQSSEHCPYIIPGSMDSEVVELMRPGMASILILSAGIVHLMTRLSQSKSRKSCDSHIFNLKVDGVGNPSSVYRAFIDMLAIDRSTPSGEIVQRNSSNLWSNIREFLEVNKSTYRRGIPFSPRKCCGRNVRLAPMNIRIGSPPPEVSKKVVPKLRSIRSIVIPPARTGRDKKHVAMKLILPAIDEIPARCREKITISTLWFGCPSQVDNGGLFNRGKDMSAAPAIMGINQFPNPLNSIGITMKKIMASAWAVTITLYCTVMNKILSISVSDSQFNGLPFGTPRGLGVFNEIGGHIPCSGISADLKNIQKNVMKKNASVVRNRIIASFVFDLMLFVYAPVVESRIESRLQ
ncbi:hypothetical protein T11_8926 [Trichinella zimbabwensis]|uniref:Uncharacterized protein n=1 Tax=Trichinella zimbabwensis TaxID=268475 RepID=A0A0V1GTM3_9BILA|nr:hypothetical protein T11_8926 [Trichinella zimbabwensis]